VLFCQQGDRTVSPTKATVLFCQPGGGAAFLIVTLPPLWRIDDGPEHQEAVSRSHQSTPPPPCRRLSQNFLAPFLRSRRHFGAMFGAAMKELLEKELAAKPPPGPATSESQPTPADLLRWMDEEDEMDTGHFLLWTEPSANQVCWCTLTLCHHAAMTPCFKSSKV